MSVIYAYMSTAAAKLNETQAAWCSRHKVSRCLLKAQELYLVFLG